MRWLWQLGRLSYITVVAIFGYDLDQLFFERYYCLSFWCKPWRWLAMPRRHCGQQLVNALVHFGPIFVKFGQILSTRRDMLPDDIVDALEQLQDKVPPFPTSQAIKKISEAYGCPLIQLFRHFDTTPLAAASVAQVYAAQRQTGEDVIIKVVRPGVRKQIQRDIALLYALASGVKAMMGWSEQLRPHEVVAEFERCIYDELDLQREAANAMHIKRNFAGSPLLHVPEVYWDYARTEVMMQERVYGVVITDMQAMRERGVNMRVLAERGVEIFFTQVLRDRFFHADMHPGNIFVDISDPEKPRYKAIDFGIVGSLDIHDQRYLAQNLLAFFQRDYRKVAELHVASGWVPADTRVDQFESAIRTVCEPIFSKPIKEISFGHLLLRLFQTARRFRMPVQPQLLLLQKTLFNIEALGRQIYPELDLWVTAKPILEQWMREQMGPRATLTEIRRQLPQWLMHLPELPTLVHQFLQQAGQAAKVPVLAEMTASKKQHSLRRKAVWLGGFLVGVGASFLVFVVMGWSLG